MPKVLRRAVHCLLDREPRWAEFGSAATALFWASATYTSLSGFQDWASMRVLLELGGERFWHLLGLGLGLSQIAVLAFDRRWARWAVAMAQGWFWGVLTLGAWVSVPWCPAIAIYAGWCGVSAMSMARLLHLLLPNDLPLNDWPFVE